MERKEKLERGEKEKARKKRERLEEKAKLEERWAMMRWLIEFTEENQPQWDADKEIRRGEKSGETTCTIEEIRKEEIPSVAQVNLKKGGAEKIERKEQQQQTENITENITEMRDL